MKDWQVWTLVVICVLVIIGFCWWLTTVLSILTCIYITIVVNGIMTFYLMMEYGSKKKK